jgi:hypothetical protein
MSIDIRQNVDTNSPEFKEGVEAGLNSAEDTNNWKAGNELGQELKEEGEEKAPAYESSFKNYATPLFMKDSRNRPMGNPQDEKDETEE